jgi:hypothetical protein
VTVTYKPGYYAQGFSAILTDIADARLERLARFAVLKDRVIPKPTGSAHDAAAWLRHSDGIPFDWIPEDEQLPDGLKRLAALRARVAPHRLAVLRSRAKAMR